jgi:uncharacterized protein DUF3995
VDSARSGRLAALAAAALAFASAAVSLYWTLGGTGLLDTVGGEIERLARERSAPAVAVIAATAVAKLLAGALALALPRSDRRPLFLAAIGGGALLALYGAVLVVAGALVLAGAIDPSDPVDEYALRWHVFVWDMWFVLWGVALALAGVLARRRQAATDASASTARS